MEILLWLVPPVVVTVLAMVWVSWLGREGRGQVGRDEAVRRLAVALEKDAPTVRRVVREPRQRSTGVAVRRPPVAEATPVVEPRAPASVSRPRDPWPETEHRESA